MFQILKEEGQSEEAPCPPSSEFVKEKEETCEVHTFSSTFSEFPDKPPSAAEARLNEVGGFNFLGVFRFCF